MPVLIVGPGRVRAECGGFDVELRRRDLDYAAILDLRDKYSPHQELDLRAGRITISIRDLRPNPFIGADIRHPLGSRRRAVISGKYAGGVFCTISDGTDCLCLYSNVLYDADFYPGDMVLIYIIKHDYDRQLVYGRIITKC